MQKNIFIATAMVLLFSASSFAQQKETTAPPAEEPQPISFQQSPRLWNIYGGVGFPHGFNLGFEYLDTSRTWSMNAEAGGFNYKPKDEETDKEEIALGSLSVEGHYYPFQSAFFIGGALGTQAVRAKKTVTVLSETVSPEVKIANAFLTPKVGWLWRYDSGFTLGFDLGAQIPLNSKVDIEDGTTNPLVLNDPDYIQSKEDAKDIADKLGKMVLPHVSVRFGYSF